MRDIFIDSNGETNFDIVNDREALRSQIGVFLITDVNSLDYHTDYGLDYKKILLNGQIDLSLKSSHIKSQLNLYFKEYFRSPPVVEISKSARNLNFVVRYLSIYGGEDVVEI